MWWCDPLWISKLCSYIRWCDPLWIWLVVLSFGLCSYIRWCDPFNWHVWYFAPVVCISRMFNNCVHIFGDMMQWLFYIVFIYSMMWSLANFTDYCIYLEYCVHIFDDVYSVWIPCVLFESYNGIYDFCHVFSQSVLVYAMMRSLANFTFISQTLL